MRILLLLSSFLSVSNLWSQTAVRALDLDGGHARVSALPLNGSNFTIESWVLLPDATTPNNHIIFSQPRSGDLNGISFGIQTLAQGGYVYLQVDGGSGTHTAAGTNIVMASNTWYHVAATYDASSGQSEIYVNGLDDGGNIAIVTFPLSTDSALVGRRLAAPSDSLIGTIDELRVFGSVVGPDDIREWVHRPLNAGHPNYANLLLYYKMDEVGGGTLTDGSPAARTGVLKGNFLRPSSTIPMPSLTLSDLRAIWAGVREDAWPYGETESAKSDLLALTEWNAQSLNPGEHVLFGHDDGPYAPVTTGLPFGVARRLSRVWRVETEGPPHQVNLSFDVTPLVVSDPSSMRILIDTDGDFSNASVLTNDNYWDPTKVDKNDVSVPNGAYITVASVSSGNLNEPIRVTNSNDAGAGSFRAALDTANTRSGADRIEFDNVGEIDLVSELPALTDPLTTIISNSSTSINASALSAGEHGLTILSHSNVIEELRIGGNSAAGNAGLRISGTGAHNNIIRRCWFGLDYSTTPQPNYIGILVDGGAHHNVIGDDYSTQGNTMSNNLQEGLLISGVGTDSNIVRGNKIGLDPGGNGDMGNSGSGIRVDQAIGTLIGGPSNLGNVIGANGAEGILLENGARGTGIRGNYIGVDIYMLAHSNAGSGILLDSSNANQIGSSDVQERNYIGRNYVDGITIDGSDSNVIVGNLIGVDPAGGTIGNSRHGVFVNNSKFNRIGGPTVAEGNTISFNSSEGVYFQDSYDSWIESNRIGTDQSGNNDAGNDGAGIRLEYSFDIFVGGTTPGSGNVISGNATGVAILGGAHHRLYQNTIGLNIGGTSSIGNDEGVEIEDSDSNWIGTGFPDGRNLISGNNGAGIRISTQSFRVIGNKILGNYIGTNKDGFAVGVGNTGHGIHLSAFNDNIIGDSIAFNRIADNDTGIVIQSSGSGHVDSVIMYRNAIFDHPASGIKVYAGQQGDPIAPAVTSLLPNTVLGTANANAKIHVYADIGDEGKFYLGETTSDGGGSWSLSVTVPQGLFVTALQDLNGRTGPFSNAMNIVISDSLVVTKTHDSATEPGTLRFATWYAAVFHAGPDSIKIHASLAGEKLEVNDAYGPIAVNGDSTRINGDLNNDGVPDVTLLGSILTNAFRITMSDNHLSGFRFLGFDTSVVISGSNAQNNRITSCYFGTDGVELRSATGGIKIADGAQYNMIGDNTSFGRNVFAGHERFGVLVEGIGTDYNDISGNYIGPDITGQFPTENKKGVEIKNGAENNKITGNLISGNFEEGVEIYAADYNDILGNFIGTTANGLAALSNGGGGIHVNLSNQTDIGDATGQGRNVVSGNNENDSPGIEIEFSNDCKVFNNLVGLGADGVTPLGNAGAGIIMHGGSRNWIGSNAANTGNVISANALDGIWIRGGDSPGDSSNFNKVKANIVGLDQSGSTSLGNGGHGVRISGYYVTEEIGIWGPAWYNEIGDASGTGRNLISSNGFSGVAIEGFDAPHSIIAGNYVGVDITGNQNRKNGMDGVTIFGGADSSLVYENVISGHFYVDAGGDTAGAGILIQSAEYVRMFRNNIGTNAAGTAPIGNGWGILVLSDDFGSFSQGHWIGDGTAGMRNLISGNLRNGISMDSAYHVKIAGNFIGTDGTGTLPIPNLGMGVDLHSGSTADTLQSNTIAFNGQAGIGVAGALTDSNVFWQNLILENQWGGILFKPGDGVQKGVAPPRITSVTATTVTGKSAPNAFVQVYADRLHGNQGRTILATTTANGSGDWTATVSFGSGDIITAMQDSAGHSSELAMFIPLLGVLSTPNGTDFDFGNVVLGDSAFQTLMIIPQNGIVIFPSAGAPPQVPFSAVSSNFSTPDTVAPGDTMRAVVRFAPTALGSYADTIEFSNSSATNPLVIILHGNGIVAAGLLGSGVTAIDYIPTRVGDSISAVVKLTATIGNVIVSQIQNATTDYRSDAVVLPDTIGTSNDSLQLTVWFRPQQTGSRIDTLKVTSNSTGGTPLRVVLRGTGLENVPPVLTLGVLRSTIAKSSVQVVVVSNEGLAGITGTATLGGTTNLTMTGSNSRVFSTSYAIRSTGSLVLDVSAQDSVGNPATASKTYSVLSLTSKALTGEFDGVRVGIPKGGVSSDGFLLGSYRADELTLGMQKAATANWLSLGDLDLLLTTDMNRGDRLTVTVPYDAKALAANRATDASYDERKVGVYERVGDTWEYLGGEGQSGAVQFKTGRGGTFAVFYNPDHAFLPKKLELSQNYPNPFNPTTTIQFGLPDESRVRLVVYNILGQKVAELFNGSRRAGYHTVVWNGRNDLGRQVASGVYLYRLESSQGVVSRKMLLLK